MLENYAPQLEIDKTDLFFETAQAQLTKHREAFASEERQLCP
jgi:hypothetical protein